MHAIVSVKCISWRSFNQINSTLHLGVSVEAYYAVNIKMASKLINIIIAVILIIFVILAIILLSLTLTNADHNHSKYSPTETTPYTQ